MDSLFHALSFAFGMFWEILWALILGFFLSAVRPGGGLQGRTAAAAARQFAAFTGARHRLGRRILVVFVRRGRPGPVLWGPIAGPLVAIVSFVCSIGNVPLAAVLWNGGISFGGVIAFIFADLIVLPILDIYRKYYGWRVAGFLFATFFAAMAAAGLLIEWAFGGLGIIPAERKARVVEASVQWNYTTFLNVAFLVLAAWLLIRFIRTGGVDMIRNMSKPKAALKP